MHYRNENNLKGINSKCLANDLSTSANNHLRLICKLVDETELISLEAVKRIVFVGG